jgi:uncharacterized membrane protein
VQDPAFGFRELVDIAIRALSPAVNDPTTGVQAIDRLSNLHVIYFNEARKGGHFAAWEEPQLFAEEVRAGFGRSAR